MYHFVQLAWIFLELWLGFQDHVILVELRVHGVDLALAEGIVEGVVHGGGSQTQA